MRSAFANRARVRRRCLGLTLQPLSLGHLFLLAELDSPLLLRDAEITVADLALAAFVCAQPHNESRRDLGKWWFPTFAVFLGLLARWRNLANEAKSFCDYIDDETEAPAVKRRVPIGDMITTDSKPEPIIPLHWMLLEILMSQFGMNHAEAMAFPVHDAQLLALVKQDREHGVSFVTDYDRAFEEFCREMEQKELLGERN